MYGFSSTWYRGPSVIVHAEGHAAPRPFQKPPRVRSRSVLRVNSCCRIGFSAGRHCGRARIPSEDAWLIVAIGHRCTMTGRRMLPYSRCSCRYLMANCETAKLHPAGSHRNGWRAWTRTLGYAGWHSQPWTIARILEEKRASPVASHGFSRPPGLDTDGNISWRGNGMAEIGSFQNWDLSRNSGQARHRSTGLCRST